MNTTEQPAANLTGASTRLAVPGMFPPFSLTRLLTTVFYPKIKDPRCVVENEELAGERRDLF